MPKNIITNPHEWAAITGYSLDSLYFNQPIIRDFSSIVPFKYQRDFSNGISKCSSVGSVYSNSFDSLQHTVKSPYAHLVSSLNQRVVDYYVFPGDDKYFHSHERLWFHDTHLYSSFYLKLPDLDLSLNCMTYNVSDPLNTLFIFSRQQFGHFLFDDLLPCLAAMQELNEKVKSVVLFYSLDWQCEVTQTLFELYSPSTQLIFHKLPSSSCKIAFSGLSLIPVYPEILYRIRSVLRLLTSSPTVGSVYLHRGGYRGENRITNYQHYLDSLRIPATILVPHKTSFKEVFHLLKSSSHVISEPGTLPLLAYMASSNTNTTVIFSKRCLSDCSLEYFYSGWRYHLPWLDRVQPIWMQVKSAFANPFSDVGSIPKLLFQRVL